MAAPPPAQQKAIVAQAAGRYGIPANILWGVYGTESGFGRNLGPSSAGAVGYFQFEPGTAASLGVNPYDFKSAAFGAAKYLSQFKGRGTAGMLSAYNAGPAGGLQPSYVQSVLSNAKSFGGVPRGAGGIVSSPGTRNGSPFAPGNIPLEPINQPVTQFNQAGYNKALNAYKLGTALSLQKQQAAAMPKIQGLPKGLTPTQGNLGPLYDAGLISNQAPNRADFMHVHMQTTALQSLRNLAGPSGASLNAPPGIKSARMASSGAAGGFLPAGARYTANRQDQGRDGQTNPGGPIIAPGDGYVLRVASDPNGFGPSYPIVHFTSGRFAGHDMYVGHTYAVLHAGEHFRAGQVLSHTGTHGVGNATVPGWFEIGYAPGGTPGAFGQPAPF